jgi:hypothetical protein
MVEGYAETVAALTGTGTLDPGQPARPSPDCRAKLEFELVAKRDAKLAGARNLRLQASPSGVDSSGP